MIAVTGAGEVVATDLRDPAARRFDEGLARLAGAR